MPHVSKELPPEDQLLDILRQFYSSLLALDDTGSGRDVLNQLFTQTEKIMLAKRLAIIFMLEKGATFSVIQETLKVSTSTVSRISENLQAGEYDAIVSFYTDQESDKYIENLIGLLNAFTPKRMGAERWSWLDE